MASEISFMGIASLLSTIYGAAVSTSKKPISSFSFLETTDGKNTIVGKDGSLMSMIKVDGVKQVMGEEELNHVVEVLSSKLSANLSQPGHAIQVWFTRDPDLSKQLIKSQLVPSRATARQLNLELEDLFSERERHLPKFVVYESYYIALWTRLTSLTKPEREKAKIDAKPPEIWPQMSDTQDLFRAAKPLRDRHMSFVKGFVGDLADVDIRAELMDAHDAIRAVKWSIYPDLIGADWRPTLRSDNTPMREPEINDVDMSHLMWPRLDNQIFSQEAERINPRIVRVGSRYFAGVDMTVGPMETKPFSELLTRMIDNDEFPWRVSFLIEGDGLSTLGIKAFLAAIFTMTNSENRAIKDAVAGLQEARLNGMVVTRMRVSFATWAPATDLALIEERSSRLQRAVEGWGWCSVAATAGDPLAGTLSSALGLNTASTAPPGAVPLENVLQLLPLNRDASPWQQGAIMFRTPDRRIWPFAPGSSQQDTFIDLIFAPPGKGKSVYLNTANLALALSPISTQGIGGAMLPQIAILDIGPSSSGLISLLKEALPPHRRHEVEYRRMTMRKSYAINPFDTQLGCRTCSQMERSFLINFLSAIGTPPGASAPPSGLPEMAGFCVDQLYELYSDKNSKGTPKIYTPTADAAVDAKVNEHDIRVNDGTLWWDLVDKFFELGDEHAAMLAQRHAVPLLDDLGVVMNSERIRDVFKTAKTDNGEPTIDAFRRMIISALREYPILSIPTRFDVGQARIFVLDLDEVAPRGSGPAAKQTALMYMLGRFVLAKDFYLNPELLDQKDNNGHSYIPELYHDYHEKRIRRIRESPKRLVYDEFHRTAQSPAVRDQVLIDIREGRKWGVHIALASQLLQDFDPAMVDMASGIWIMGVGNDRAAEDAAKLFNLSDTAVNIMRRNLTGPGPAGAPFLAVLYLKTGRHEHLLYNTLGPTEIWAFSTTAEDASLRNRLYARVGAVDARKRLARMFPSGSAKREIERRLNLQAETGNVPESAQDGVINEILEEVLRMHMD